MNALDKISHLEGKLEQANDLIAELTVALKAMTVELAWLNDNERILANAPERRRINARLDIARAAIAQAQGDEG